MIGNRGIHAVMSYRRRISRDLLPTAGERQRGLVHLKILHRSRPALSSCSRQTPRTIGVRHVVSGRTASGPPDESLAPVAAVDLPCPVGSLDDVESNRAGLYRRAAAAAADLPPALCRDTRHATMAGEPGCGGNRRWLTAAVRHQ